MRARVFSVEPKRSIGGGFHDAHAATAWLTRTQRGAAESDDDAADNFDSDVEAIVSWEQTLTCEIGVRLVLQRRIGCSQNHTNIVRNSCDDNNRNSSKLRSSLRISV